MENNKKHIGEAIDLNHKGEGVIKSEKGVVFVKGALIGDIVEYEIASSKKGLYTANLTKIISPSSFRTKYDIDIKPFLSVAPLIELDYEKQLEWKRQLVETTLKRIGKIETKVNEIVGMIKPFNFRNHTQIPFGLIDDKIIYGYYKAESYKVIPIKEDILGNQITTSILKVVKEWAEENKVSPFDRYKKTGDLKHVGIRTNCEGEAMVIVVTKGFVLPSALSLAHKLIKEAPGVVSVYHNPNPEEKTTYGRKFDLVFGREKLIDYIGALKFEISPGAFFQINRTQALELYRIAKDYLNPEKEDTVIDLYSGIGTISLFVADKVKSVVGIEAFEKSVENAKENAALNNIKNATFLNGKAEDVLLRLVEQNIKANKLIVDPPRKGLEKSVIASILDLKPERIVYVSCNPSTLARDLALFVEGGYRVEEVTPVDMFCHSSHVESIILMTYCGSEEKK